MGMIDIGDKEKTNRVAKAQSFVKLPQRIIGKIRANSLPKGNVIETARIAGILAVKKTPEIVPLCHTIEIEKADVDFQFKKTGLLIITTVQATAKTGVEMEALCAASTAALAVYDMCKKFSKTIEITDIYLLEKTGGKSGNYTVHSKGR